jgi:transposase-like protein
MAPDKAGSARARLSSVATALDEVFVKVNGKLCYLWRAVDHEGEVLEAVVTASGTTLRLSGAILA